MQGTRTQTRQTIYPAVRYNDAKAAIAWLTSVLGFEERQVYANDDGTIAHAELSLNGNLIMLGSAKGDSFGKSPSDLGGVTATVYIALDSADEVDARFVRVKKAGAKIVRELCDMDYGSREFTIADAEGHIWSFGTYQPQVE
jgi:uncharacterized glyoxalase superfamily protein PhnB